MFDHELNSLASTLAIASSALALVTFLILQKLFVGHVIIIHVVPTIAVEASENIESLADLLLPMPEPSLGENNVNQLYNLQSLVKRFEQSDKLTRPHRAGFHVQKRTYSVLAFQDADIHVSLPDANIKV
ncbi:hypothetical protein KCU87_g14, partial [Aureobasidium melanogenum]